MLRCRCTETVNLPDPPNTTVPEIKSIVSSSPSVVHAGFRYHTPFLGEGGVVGIPFGTASVVGGPIVGIEGGVLAKPFR